MRSPFIPMEIHWASESKAWGFGPSPRQRRWASGVSWMCPLHEGLRDVSRSLPVLGVRLGPSSHVFHVKRRFKGDQTTFFGHPRNSKRNSRPPRKERPMAREWLGGMGMCGRCPRIGYRFRPIGAAGGEPREHGFCWSPFQVALKGRRKSLRKKEVHVYHFDTYAHSNEKPQDAS